MSHTYTTGNIVPNGGSTITLSGTGGAGTSMFNTGAGSNGTFLTTGAGGVGQIYTTGTTTANYTWQNPNDNVMVVTNSPPALEVKGKMVINGQDLEERLNTIEKVLQIPERDVKLEKKHPKLKKLYDDYIAALGKYRTFEAIKGDEDGTT